MKVKYAIAYKYPQYIEHTREVKRESELDTLYTALARMKDLKYCEDYRIEVLDEIFRFA